MSINDTAGAPPRQSLRSWLEAPTAETPQQATAQAFWRGWQRLARNPAAMMGLVILLVLIFAAVFAPVLATYDPYQQDLARRLQPPSAAHWFGTDDLGRDIYSRIIHGARITLYIAFLAAAIAGPIGLIVGATAGYIGGWVDTLAMRVVDVFLSFPGLILALAFVAALGAGIQNAIIAISLAAGRRLPGWREPRRSACAIPSIFRRRG